MRSWAAGSSAPGGAENTTNSAGMSAVDLDGDGYLDVIGSVHDAQGVNYWLTFGWTASSS